MQPIIPFNQTSVSSPEILPKDEKTKGEQLIFTMNYISVNSPPLPESLLTAKTIDELKQLPIQLTRDYEKEGFPFPLVPQTAQDKEDLLFNYVKFQTPYYTAYVDASMQNYIKPEHLYQEHESLAMKEARKCVWGNSTGKERYDTRKNYPKEFWKVHEEEDELFAQAMRDSRDSHPELSDAYEAIQNKYSVENYMWKSMASLSKSELGKIGLITVVAASAIAAVVFFLSQFLPTLVTTAIVIFKRTGLFY